MSSLRKRCRVFKKPDGGVMYCWPGDKYQETENFDELNFPDFTEGLEYVDLYEDELPSEKGRDWFYHGPLVMDGKCSKENLKFDENWEHHLMPSLTIKKKHIKRLESEMEKELGVKDPDIMKIQKLRLTIDKQKEISASALENDSYWLEIASSNLDKLVSSGGADKPKIRAKIAEKIKEINKQNKE